MTFLGVERRTFCAVDVPAAPEVEELASRNGSREAPIRPPVQDQIVARAHLVLEGRMRGSDERIRMSRKRIERDHA